MGFENVKKVKCVDNYNMSFSLTVGKIYGIANLCRIDSKGFMIFNDEGYLSTYGRENFEIIETELRDKMGWDITCRDCRRNYPLKDIIKEVKCPNCGQKFE